jgi:hypothetical protein
MQSLSNGRKIPDIIFVDNNKRIPSSSKINQRRESKRRKQRTYRCSREDSQSQLFAAEVSKEKSKATNDLLSSTSTMKYNPTAKAGIEGSEYVDSIQLLSSEDEVDRKEKPKRIARRRVMRRSSIDIGTLQNQNDWIPPEAESSARRRKSINNVGHLALPFSYDHSIEDQNDSSISDDIDFFVNSRDVIRIGMANVSKPDPIEAIFNSTSATLEESMMNLTFSEASRAPLSFKSRMEPMLSLSDLCGTLIPPRIIVEQKLVCDSTSSKSM